MASIEISGLNIAYELLGKAGARAVALTPGGRFSKDTPGLRELGEALAQRGFRVLLWDRPNCGDSDMSLNAANESALHARTLTQLIRALELGPTALAGGSAGSRVSLMAAAHDPDAISHLFLWWISGGNIGLMNLAMHYCGEAALLASTGGMAAAAASASWTEHLGRNAKSRAHFLACDPGQFIEAMQQWAGFYAPSLSSPVPGLSPQDFERLRMPVMVLRSGASDLAHTRRTSEWLHEMIPHSILKEPPWPDAEWNVRCGLALSEGRGLFEGWPALAPIIAEFIAV